MYIYSIDNGSCIAMQLCFLLLLCLSFVGCGAEYPEFPLKRSFLKFPVQEIPPSIFHQDLRVLQFNILADGLSGLRKDLGAFSRVTSEAVAWENRKGQLLKEVTQYSPDIITMQENDHYYDFFLEKLSTLGYDGYFAPKPASAVSCVFIFDL